MAFREELTTLINRHSRENGSNTPDYVLAHFLANVLEAFDGAVRTRDGWYGIHPTPAIVFQDQQWTRSPMPTYCGWQRARAHRYSDRFDEWNCPACLGRHPHRGSSTRADGGVRTRLQLWLERWEAAGRIGPRSWTGALSMSVSQ
jgi:hypothetical protein